MVAIRDARCISRTHAQCLLIVSTETTSDANQLLFIFILQANEAYIVSLSTLRLLIQLSSYSCERETRSCRCRALSQRAQPSPDETMRIHRFIVYFIFRINTYIIFGRVVCAVRALTTTAQQQQKREYGRLSMPPMTSFAAKYK